MMARTTRYSKSGLKRMRLNFRELEKHFNQEKAGGTLQVPSFLFAYNPRPF